MSLLIRNAKVVIGDGTPAFASNVRVEAGQIAELGDALSANPGEEVFDAERRVLLPGFVDAHTHALFAGDRLDEFDLLREGKSYLEILAAGGGIFSTVRAVRQASEQELRVGLARRLRHMLREGTTSVEVKSGYGLSTDHELKMLRAIAGAAREFPGTVVATALLGHAIDPEQPHFVDRVVEETLPAVHAEFPGICIDAYCERGAWSVEDCRRLLVRARELEHPVRLHADQFNALGGAELALELGACSIDHLEASSAESLERIARSATSAVMLPVSGFQTDRRYANARKFVDAGGQLVLATNYNPGSSPCCSMPFVVALAVRELQLNVLEAISAVTHHAARLLGLPDRGIIRVGARADLVLLRHDDPRLLGYEIGGNPVEHVWVNGRQLT